MGHLSAFFSFPHTPQPPNIELYQFYLLNHTSNPLSLFLFHSHALPPDLDIKGTRAPHVQAIRCGVEGED